MLLNAKVISYVIVLWGQLLVVLIICRIGCQDENQDALLVLSCVLPLKGFFHYCSQGYFVGDVVAGAAVRCSHYLQ